MNFSTIQYPVSESQNVITGTLPNGGEITIKTRLSGAFEVRIVVTLNGATVHDAPPTEEDKKAFNDLRERASVLAYMRTNRNRAHAANAAKEAGIF